MLFSNPCQAVSEDGNIYTRHFAKDPAVVRFKERYFLYFSAYADNSFKLRVGIAISDDMENWQFTGLMPLDQPCETNGVGAPAAIVLNGVIHLFYQTYGNGVHDAICHAVSTDGLHFVKDQNNPVFRPATDWCCGRAIDADLVVFRDKLFLYFATRDQAFVVQKVGTAYASLDSDFSSAAWTEAADNPCMEPALPWEMSCIEAPATIVDGDRLYMFYGGAYNCAPQQIGCAVSDDGIHFRRLSDTPFMPPGIAGSWNACESGHPYAFRDDDGRAYLFYQGSPDMGKSWYLSRVGLNFREGIPYPVFEKS